MGLLQDSAAKVWSAGQPELHSPRPALRLSPTCEGLPLIVVQQPPEGFADDPASRSALLPDQAGSRQVWHLQQGCSDQVG